MTAQNVFSTDLDLGNKYEDILVETLRLRGLRARTVDYKAKPYDIEMKTPDGTILTVELKFARDKGFKNFYAETWSHGKMPQYLTADLDLMVYFSSDEQCYYFYDHAAFKAYVLSKKNVARANKFGSAKGITFPKASEQAGFIRKLYLDGTASDDLPF